MGEEEEKDNKEEEEKEEKYKNKKTEYKEEEQEEEEIGGNIFKTLYSQYDTHFKCYNKYYQVGKGKKA